MKFLADMGLARNTVAFLRARGHDAIHLRDEGLQRLGDDKIVEKALAPHFLHPRLLCVLPAGNPCEG
jgi:predicted nuclease of predicted toxin-antitoxin system